MGHIDFSISSVKLFSGHKMTIFRIQTLTTEWLFNRALLGYPDINSLLRGQAWAYRMKLTQLDLNQSGQSGYGRKVVNSSTL